MSWTWEFTKKSAKQFERLDNQTRVRILERLDFWVKSGKPLVFAENLHQFDLGSYRFRIGDYRVIFDVEEDAIVVLAVGHRKEIYKS